jgi:hypothetical protein
LRPCREDESVDGSRLKRGRALAQRNLEATRYLEPDVLLLACPHPFFVMFQLLAKATLSLHPTDAPGEPLAVAIDAAGDEDETGDQVGVGPLLVLRPWRLRAFATLLP